MDVQIITNLSATYKIIMIDGEKYHEGSDIPSYVFIDLLEKLGAKVSNDTITDQTMEELY